MKVTLYSLIGLIGLANCSSDFKSCTEYVHSSTVRAIREADKLKAYGLYKQATSGDCPAELAPNSDIYARTKHTAWCSQRGKSREVAEVEYVALIDRLAPEWRDAIKN